MRDRRERKESFYLINATQPRCSLLPLPGGESHASHNSGTSPFPLTHLRKDTLLLTPRSATACESPRQK